MKHRSRFICLLAAVMMLSAFMPCIAEEEDNPALAEGADLRIMSFNILHPEWSRVPVKGRDEIVTEILRYYMPDVVALQEAGAQWHKALKPILMDTGEYATACRQSNADGFLYNTTCFLYNPQTVRLAEEYILDLDYKSPSRVFAVAVFERLSDGARFVMTNTHPAPRDDPENYARNMSSLTAFAAETAGKYAGLPIIIAGDFNTPEDSELYLALMDEAGVRDAKYEAAVLVRNCSTFFGYQIAPDPENTDLCVDHLFVNDRVDVRLFNEVIGHNVQNASDHIPIYIDIDLK
jgi:endonuclease/exonuclease/phosphatase family metal-dependent hydrolase